MDNAKLSEVLYPVQTYMCQKASPRKIKTKKYAGVHNTNFLTLLVGNIAIKLIKRFFFVFHVEYFSVSGPGYYRLHSASFFHFQNC